MPLRKEADKPEPWPRINTLWINNYRSIKNITLSNISPLTVLLGPNGSGKSTILDTLAFLSDCVTQGLRNAVDNRGGIHELVTKDANTNEGILLGFLGEDDSKSKVFRYDIQIAAHTQEPWVMHETIHAKNEQVELTLHNQQGKIGYTTTKRGKEGKIISKDQTETLARADALALDVLGQPIAKDKNLGSLIELREYVTDWQTLSFSSDRAKTTTNIGIAKRLSPKGDNLPSVIEYMQTQGKYWDNLKELQAKLAQRIPRFESVAAERNADGSLTLLFQDSSFERSINARFTSDGTIKMLAYLVALFGPDPAKLMCIEEPENHLHPRLLAELAEECRMASQYSQLFVATHSPHFVDSLRPEEVCVVYRDEKGYTNTKWVSEMKGIDAHMSVGASLGDLWMENFFEYGDPFASSGDSTTKKTSSKN